MMYSNVLFSVSLADKSKKYPEYTSSNNSPSPPIVPSLATGGSFVDVIVIGISIVSTPVFPSDALIVISPAEPW